MTIDQTLVDLLVQFEELNEVGLFYHARAIMLAIHSLDRIRYARLHPDYDFCKPLPGEN